MGWLATHLEEFVKPRLGFVPEVEHFFTQEELTVMKNIWRSVKRQAGSRPVLLAGRDVFVFEVLARRENFHTVFRPDISRATVHLIPKDLYRGYYLFDTGFAGSIAKSLGLDSFILASALRPMANRYQVFPNLKGSRTFALKIEATPKYWTIAQYDDDKIMQTLSPRAEFERAASITIQVYKNSAPKFVERCSPLPTGRWQDLPTIGG